MANILISGAGIAGPTLAFWLSRSGHAVTVVERAADRRTGGQAVDLRGAGRTVVERMGLMPAVRDVMLDQKGMAWVDRHGQVRARMAADAFDGKGFISEVEILRGDLTQILHDATSADVEYRYADTVTAVRQDETGVDVTFHHAPPQRFDLVVGADGLASPVRRLAFGEDGKKSLGYVVAWFSALDPGDLDGWYVTHLAGRGRVASIRPGRATGDAKASLGLRIDPREPLPAHRADQQALLRRRFAGCRWRVPDLLEAMDSAADFSLAEIAQVHLPAWSTGRVALIGDAAASPSPITGLGTSVALVQAYLLAEELTAAPRDLRLALSRWEQACRPYVTTAQTLPPGGASGFAPTSRLMITLQVMSMRAANHWPIRPILAKQFRKADDVRLPPTSTRSSAG